MTPRPRPSVLLLGGAGLVLMLVVAAQGLISGPNPHPGEPYTPLPPLAPRPPP